MSDLVEAASRIPDAVLHVLPGSHFLPLEFPDELAQELNALLARTDLPSNVTSPVDSAGCCHIAPAN
jgi:hypothetical protein